MVATYFNKLKKLNVSCTDITEYCQTVITLYEENKLNIQTSGMYRPESWHHSKVWLEDHSSNLRSHHTGTETHQELLK